MKKALQEAHCSYEKDEVPIGAIIVSKNKIIARSHNLTEQLTDFTAHAEMQVFTAASEYLQNKYLTDCTLYVTIEPCVMCAGAAYWAQLRKVVIGASDEQRGFLKLSENVLHPKTEVITGIMKEECSTLLNTFFAKKR
jgi:tRNA(adenine34) deaminase